MRVIRLQAWRLFGSSTSKFKRRKTVLIASISSVSNLISSGVRVLNRSRSSYVDLSLQIYGASNLSSIKTCRVQCSCDITNQTLSFLLHLDHIQMRKRYSRICLLITPKSVFRTSPAPLPPVSTLVGVQVLPEAMEASPVCLSTQSTLALTTTSPFQFNSERVVAAERAGSPKCSSK